MSKVTLEDIEQAQKTFEKLKSEYEKQKEEWVTVTDGFRGSLKRDFWVKNNGGNAWQQIKDGELFARKDYGSNNSRYIYVDGNNNTAFTPYLKFKPFTIENPPPVDWPCNVGDNDCEEISSFFSCVENEEFRYFLGGKPSRTNQAELTNKWKFVKWLNIEKVEA
jgi:hypothetical protein